MLPLFNISAKEPDKLYLVPFHQNSRFHTREDTLSRLHESLHGSTDRQKSCLIHGGAGMGKTQLAVEYSYKHRADFDYIVWISAETDLELTKGMGNFAKRLELCSDDESKSRASREAAKIWLEQTSKAFQNQASKNILLTTQDEDKNWLLIFDNADSYEDLRSYWPYCAHGSILITSQVSELGQFTASNIQLRPFSHADGGRMLLAEVGVNSNSQHNFGSACNISQALGGLPLAISHVAGYIRQSQTGLDDFLSRFQNRQTSSQIFREAINAPYYEKTLWLIYDIAFQELDESLRKLAQILSMLSPEGVPVEMLSDQFEEHRSILGTSGSSLR